MKSSFSSSLGTTIFWSSKPLVFYVIVNDHSGRSLFGRSDHFFQKGVLFVFFLAASRMHASAAGFRCSIRAAHSFCSHNQRL